VDDVDALHLDDVDPLEALLLRLTAADIETHHQTTAVAGRGGRL
jgi:hypothetical protein